uniref:Phorbol-ester/DAG-type domain-containing protein n=1 Tax=Caenorhabditis tropicalis TaxID=1561998 RepID=A0A1I7TQW8_9PELO
MSSNITLATRQRLQKRRDAHKFEKPLSVSVQRAESARVPQLLISQPSFDLRRTQSESHLDAKVIDAVLSSSSDFGMENSVEDEIKMLLVGDLNRSASAGHNLDPQLLGVVRKDDKDKTLTQADAAKGLALIASQTGSVASLASMLSNRTDTGTEDCGDDEETHLDRKRSASTRKAKIQATFAAGKKKVLDLMPQKRKLTDASPLDFNGESIEIGADALYDTDTGKEPSIGRSPMAAVGKRKDSPSEDKKEKKRLKKKLSESPKIRRTGGSVQKDQSPMATIKARTTKSVQFQKDVMWGQSLHFELDSEPTTRSTIRYLNVTVHAKEIKSAGTPNTSATNILPNVQTPSTPDSVASSSTNTDSSVPMSPTRPSESKPILLGSVSLFVPQLIDDCRLTLSNCHREVFQLKQPNTTAPPQPSAEDPIISEFSRHAGFDPRLCFGDITLGFRYFPEGFPTDKAINSGDDSEDEQHRIHHANDAASPTRPLSPPAFSLGCHDWKLWYGKNATTCAMCRGKIWLRNASTCSRCLVICHNKCVSKANNGGIACSPQQLVPPSNLPLPPDDTAFEEISASELDTETPEEHPQEEKHALIMQSPSMSSSVSGSLDTPETSKRARFRKVTEKFSNWRKGGKKNESTPGRRDTLDTDNGSNSSADGSQNHEVTDRDSPMASIQNVLSDVLPELDGSPFISGLYFQPGNAYNEQTIRNAKLLGREIFSELPPEQRVEKINSQIDRIQTAIRETKDDRLSVMQSGGESTAKFQGLDERLQALAVLMLHYCSALQDCQSGRSTPNPPTEEDAHSREMSDAMPSVNAGVMNEEDEESVMDEDTVVADAPLSPIEEIPHPLERPTHLHPNSEALIS